VLVRSFKNDCACIKLTENNLLFTGETKRIRLWDLRASQEKSQIELTNENQEEDKENSDNLYKNSHFSLPSSLTMASVANRLRFQENLNLIVGSFTSLNGIVSFDIRNPKQELNLYNYHYYPVTSFDCGKYFNEHIAISAGTTKILQYDLRVIDLRKNKDDNSDVKIIPGHQAVITKLAMVFLLKFKYKI